MKKFVTMTLALLLTGCATHANITAPVVSKVYDKAYDNKSLSYSILYSQPKPGIFTGGEQLPLTPLEKAELSIASSATLSKLSDYIFQQLPSNVQRALDNNGDFKLVVEITAHHKKGPSYADYEAGKSFAKGMVTLGFGSDEYDIIADFDATYKLYVGDEIKFEKSYKVNDSVDHERGKFESFNAVNDVAGQLLEKHLIITLNNFFTEATASL